MTLALPPLPSDEPDAVHDRFPAQLSRARLAGPLRHHPVSPSTALNMRRRWTPVTVAKSGKPL